MEYIHIFEKLVTNVSSGGNFQFNEIVLNISVHLFSPTNILASNKWKIKVYGIFLILYLVMCCQINLKPPIPIIMPRPRAPKGRGVADRQRGRGICIFLKVLILNILLLLPLELLPSLVVSLLSLILLNTAY